MKNKKTKVIVALLAVFCFTILGLFQNKKTEAADPTHIVEEYSVDNAKTYFTNDTAPDCDTEGYVFAGWYSAGDSLTTDETTGEQYFAGYPLSTLEGYTSDTVQALFVEKAVLDVKAQCAVLDDDNDSKVAVVGDANTCLRFVTSVDSKKYKEVGFKVSYTYNGTLNEKESVTDYVYKQLTVADGADGESDAENFSPSDVFSKRSQYFKACIVSGIPKAAFDMNFSVRAFWKTADGATVYGQEETNPVTKTVRDGINCTYEASVGDIYYKVLETAVNNKGAETTTVTLIKNAEVAGKMAITGDVTVTNREDANITIYRAEDLNADSVFEVSEGAILTIKGTTDSDSIVLDGRTAELVNVATEKNCVMISCTKSTLNIENSTLRNSTGNSGGYGNAISITTGTLNATDTKFISNTGSRGGAAVFSAGSTATINNCQFGGTAEGEGNSSSRRGGAVYQYYANNTKGTMTIYNSEFIGNCVTSSSNGDGGAICSAASDLTVYNSRFSGNSAYNEGGAISSKSQSKVDYLPKLYLYSTNDKGESDLAIMEGNSSKNTQGGAVYIGGGTSEVTGYKFIKNSAKTNGGAILVAGASTITKCQFGGEETEGNSASGRGGAIFAYTDANVIVSDSGFLYNTTTTDGGAIAGSVTNLTIYNTKFYKNAATTNGGAISATGGSTLNLYAKNDASNSDLAIMEENSSKKEGGAVYVGSGTFNVTDYSFTANSAGTYGGAILAGGTSTITDVKCTNNHSVKQGGAIYAYENVTITGSTFTGNYTTGDGGHGGAVYVHKQDGVNHSTSITNSIFTRNYTQGTDAFGGAVCIAVDGWLKLDETASNTYTGNYHCNDTTQDTNEPYQLGEEADVLFSQNFNDVADGALPSNWTLGITGDDITAQVSNGQLCLDGSANISVNPVLVLNELPTVNDTTLHNYAIEFDMSFESVTKNSRWASLVFDYTEGTSYWHASLRQNGNVNIDQRLIADGNWSSTSYTTTVGTVDLNTTKHIRIELNGDVVTYYIDGEIVRYTVTDETTGEETTYDLTHTLSTTRKDGKLGLSCNGAKVYFDNFKIKALETVGESGGTE